MDDLIRALVCTSLVEGVWRTLSGRLDVKIEHMEKLMPGLVDEARAQCGFAELLAEESTAPAVRAAASKRADAVRIGRGESRVGGIPLVTRSPHIDRVSRQVDAHNLAGELDRLRKVRESAREDLAKARRELDVRGKSGTPGERTELENDVAIQQGLLDAAAVTVTEAEERLRKLQGAVQ